MIFEQTLKPRISVITSCFNAEKWLNECIESVRSQTFSNFEYILIDDGSSDGTRQIMEKHAALDKRIRLVFKPNTGLSDSLNQGFRIARGAWIARLDADDISDPCRLELQIKHAESNPRVVFVGSDSALIDLNGKLIHEVKYPTSHHKLKHNLLTGRKFPAHSSALISTRAFQMVGGYRNRLRRAEDRDLWLRLLDIGELRSVNRPLILLRKHNENISNDDNGYTQFVDAVACTVSYFLRLKGAQDPIELDNDLFLNFMSLIRSHLDRQDFLRHREAMRYLRLHVETGTIVGIIRSVLVFFLNPRFIYMLARREFPSTRTLKALCIKWMQK
jgi:glycosyltransferase involved in cell wall biosynthesis